MKVKFTLTNTPQKLNMTGRQLMSVLKAKNWKLGYNFNFMGNIAIFETKSKIEIIKIEVERVRNLEHVSKIEVFDENNNIIF